MREEFWKAFGRYVSPIPSVNGEKINWVNYKTGIRNIQFKMEAGKTEAIITIVVNGDTKKRSKYFNLFQSFKPYFETGFEATWEWVPERAQLDGSVISCVFCSLKEVSIFTKEDWPALIAFFKRNIIALDEFWIAHKEIFQMLE